MNHRSEKSTGLMHESHVNGGGAASGKHPAFLAINMALSNIETSLAGTRHASGLPSRRAAMAAICTTGAGLSQGVWYARVAGQRVNRGLSECGKFRDAKKTGLNSDRAPKFRIRCQTIHTLHRMVRRPAPKFLLSNLHTRQSIPSAPSVAAIVPIALSAEQVAEILLCEVETVNEQSATGNLPGLKFGRSWCFPIDALATRLSELALAEAERRRTRGRPSGVSSSL